MIKQPSTCSFKKRGIKLADYSCLLLLCFVISCTDSKPAVLRLGTNVWPGYEPLYLARHVGALQEEKVHLIELSSASQVIQAFRNHLIDAAALTLDEALILAESDNQFKVVLVMDVSNGADAIVAQAAVGSLHEIKGKLVGVENNALGAYIITRALESVNLKKTDIGIIPLDIEQQGKAFKQGKVAAVVTFEPVLHKLLNSGGHLLFDTRQIPGEVIDVLIVRSEYLELHPASVQHVLDAWFESITLMKSKPRYSAGILGQRMKLDIEATLQTYTGLHIPPPAENKRLLKEPGQPELTKKVRELGKIMYSEGLLKRKTQASSLFVDTKLTYDKK